MRVLVCQDAAEAAEKTAELIVETLANGGRPSLGLSGGATPRPVYERLSRAPWSGQLDWPGLDIFFSDERCVPPDDPQSNYAMAQSELLSKVPVVQARVHRMRGELAPAAAARGYERELRKHAGSGLGLILLGLGEDGHTASLYRDSLALKETRLWVAPSQAPDGRPRLTLTLPFLERCGRVIILAWGAGKRSIVQKILQNTPDASPLQLLKTESPPILVLDRQAAGVS